MHPEKGMGLASRLLDEPGVKQRVPPHSDHTVYRNIHYEWRLSMLRTKSLLLALITALGLAPSALADQGRIGAGEAVIFADPNFRGASRVIGGPETNLSYIRFNDTVSSIRVRGTWEICADPNFRGRCRIISGPEHRLSDIRMNDNISSLRPISGRRNVGYDRDYRDNNRGGRRGGGGLSQGVSGSRTVFFPAPRDAYGDSIRAGRSRADSFCYDNGLGRAVYSGSSRGKLVDVLCGR